MTLSYTKNFHLAVPDFLSEPWHSEFAQAMQSIDNILLGVISVGIAWQNSHTYAVGDLAFDTQTGSQFSCAVAHISAPIPTTMAADRAAHPTYWTSLALVPASMTEAQIGVENTHYMTPKRVAQAIDAQAPMIGFSAHKNAVDQTGIAHATFTKVTFGTKVYEVDGTYDPVLSRWTPVAGIVTMRAAIFVPTGLLVPGHLGLCIYRNGVLFKQTWTQTQTFEGAVAIGIDDITLGTHFYEVFVVAPTASTYQISGDPSFTFFMGHVTGTFPNE